MISRLTSWQVIIVIICLLFTSCQDESESDIVPVASSNLTENDSSFVSFSEAEEIARVITSEGNFNEPDAESAREQKNAKKEKMVKEFKIFKDKKNRNAFYVFNYESNEGFSIISADKRMIPILAYGDSSSFDLKSYQENPGLIYWLESLKEHISQLRDDEDYRKEYLDSTEYQTDESGARIANGWKPEKDNNESNQRLNYIEPCDNCGGGSGTTYPIQTWQVRTYRYWGQGCGYNDYTPVKNGGFLKGTGPCGHAPAGCGPVAVAQLMYYHRNRFNSITYNGVPINFNNMPARLVGEFGEAPDISRLMIFIADWIIIDWDADYAMALPSKIPDFLNSVGFSSSISDLNHNTVKSEVKNGRPVILKARTSGVLGISLNQHIWVCEGYRYNPNNRAQYYYMNWGQYGRSNDWYSIDHWKYTNSKGEVDDYSKGRKMILVR